MPNEMSTKDLALLKYPEAHALLVEEGAYVILSDKTEEAIQLGYFEKTEDEAWESALADIEDREAEDADFGMFDDDYDEDEDED